MQRTKTLLSPAGIYPQFTDEPLLDTSPPCSIRLEVDRRHFRMAEINMSIHRTAKPVLMLIATLVLSACGEGSDLGSVRTETRSVGSFDSISMVGTARLEIAVGDRESLSIEGKEKVISRVSTEVDGNTLYIKSKHRDWIAAGSSPRIKVRITVPRLVSLKLEGGNDVKLTGFDGGASAIRVEGAAHIKANGRLDELTVFMAGAGYADLSNLVADTTKVTVTGVGRVFVHPADTLDATMNGIGAILYTGSPREVNTHMNGLGTIGRKEGKHSFHWGGDQDTVEKKKSIDPDSLQPEYDEQTPPDETTEVT